MVEVVVRALVVAVPVVVVVDVMLPLALALGAGEAIVPGLGVVEVVARPDVVEVTGSVVVEVVLVEVVVGSLPGSPTVRGAEVPDTPDWLSVTWSAVVSGSTRFMPTLADPSVKVTLEPVVQLPFGG